MAKFGKAEWTAIGVRGVEGAWDALFYSPKSQEEDLVGYASEWVASNDHGFDLYPVDPQFLQYVRVDQRRQSPSVHALLNSVTSNAMLTGDGRTTAHWNPRLISRTEGETLRVLKIVKEITQWRKRNWRWVKGRLMVPEFVSSALVMQPEMMQMDDIFMLQTFDADCPEDSTMWCWEGNCGLILANDLSEYDPSRIMRVVNYEGPHGGVGGQPIWSIEVADEPVHYKPNVIQVAIERVESDAVKSAFLDDMQLWHDATKFGVLINLHQRVVNHLGVDLQHALRDVQLEDWERLLLHGGEQA